MGASVVNALSEYVEVEVCTGGKMYRQTFRSYEGPDGKMVSGKPMAPWKRWAACAVRALK